MIPANPEHRTEAVMGLHAGIQEALAAGDYEHAKNILAVQTDALDDAGAAKEAFTHRVIADPTNHEHIRNFLRTGGTPHDLSVLADQATRRTPENRTNDWLRTAHGISRQIIFRSGNQGYNPTTTGGQINHANNSQDHQEAVMHHYDSAQRARSPAGRQNHYTAMILHDAARHVHRFVGMGEAGSL